ncbi:hypothetical protein [Labilithrix luteola]|nr:hypothetical protein [Labilithrix luteola]
MALKELLVPSFVLVACLAGCSSWKLDRPAVAPVQAQTQVPPTAAKICVVRTAVLGSAVTFPTRDNRLLVGATLGNTHFCYLAEPGEHEITIEADAIETAKLTAEAGKSYFLKQEVDNIFGYVKCRAVWLAESEARGLFESSSYEVLVGVPGSERLPDNPPFARAKSPQPAASVTPSPQSGT